MYIDVQMLAVAFSKLPNPKTWPSDMAEVQVSGTMVIIKFRKYEHTDHTTNKVTHRWSLEIAD